MTYYRRPGRVLRTVLLTAVAVIVLAAAATAAEGTKKVAVMPWQVHSASDLSFVKKAVTDMLTSRVGSHDDIEIVRPEGAEPLTGADGEQAASRLARSSGADYVLYGSLTVLGESVSLDARLYDGSSGSARTFSASGHGLDSIVGLADRVSDSVVASIFPAAAPSTVEGVTGTPAPVITPVPAPATPVSPVSPVSDDEGSGEGEEGFVVTPAGDTGREMLWKSAKYDGAYHTMAAADLDGDGAAEIFLASGDTVLVGRVEASGVKLVGELTGLAQIVSVEAADTDGDRVEEVYVSRVVDDRPATLSIVYSGGAYKVGEKGIVKLVRVVPTAKGPVLLGQGFRGVDGFYGPLFVMKRTGSGLGEAGAYGLTLPGEIDLYRFAAFDLDGDGAEELVTIDQRYRLRVYRKDGGAWTGEWLSPEHYGGTLSFIEFRTETEGGMERRFTPVAGRFTVADADGDGAPEVIVRENTPAGIGWFSKKPTSFKKGRVTSLEWDGDTGGLAEGWTTRELDGFIADFIIADLDGDGAPEVTLLVVEGTENLFGSIKSYVLSYRLNI